MEFLVLVNVAILDRGTDCYMILCVQLYNCTTVHLYIQTQETSRDCGPNSDVRHPRSASLYNGKELRVEYTQSNTTILTSIINIMRVITITCFGLTCGPSSGCKIRLDKLHYNAWETFWEKGRGDCDPNKQQNSCKNNITLTKVLT